MKKALIIFIFLLLFFSCYKAEADTFTSDFYGHVNILRESRHLVPLQRDRSIERIAESYSAILAENGDINHFALTEFEFNSLCAFYDIPDSTLLEVLAKYPHDYVSYQVFLLFLMSEPHKEALLDPEGRFIGAGYIRKGNDVFFTAYVMIEKE